MCIQVNTHMCIDIPICPSRKIFVMNLIEMKQVIFCQRGVKQLAVYRQLTYTYNCNNGYHIGHAMYWTVLDIFYLSRYFRDHISETIYALVRAGP